MLKLYVKDNHTGAVHEYGKDSHDALYIQPDGSLQYLNLQTDESTWVIDPEDKPGYSFCLESGEIPEEEELFPYPVLDTAGLYYWDPDVIKTNRKWEKKLAKAMRTRKRLDEKENNKWKIFRKKHAAIKIFS